MEGCDGTGNLHSTPNSELFRTKFQLQYNFSVRSFLESVVTKVYL